MERPYRASIGTIVTTSWGRWPVAVKGLADGFDHCLMARNRVFAALLCATLGAATLTTATSTAGAAGQLFGAGDDPVMRPAISADGRYIAFHSEQGFLVKGDTNGFSDVFVLDRVTDQLELISRIPLLQANGGSSFADISADGRYVAFHSQATMLVPDDTNQAWDVFVYDRVTETLDRVSVAVDGTEGNGSSFFASISDDGRYVAFHSEATNLHPDDTDATADVYVKDRQTNAVHLISSDGLGGSGDGPSHVPALSGDGRYVAFESAASNLVAGDNNNKFDVFVRDLQNGTTELVSDSHEGFAADDNSFLPQISADGRYVAFESYATNIVTGDTNAVGDVFVHDRNDGSTIRVSTAGSGTIEADDRSLAISISDDGQRVVYHSWAANLDDDDTNDLVDVYQYTLGDADPIRLSETANGQGNGPSALPRVSGDGSTVAFESLASNLDAADDDAYWDVFAYETGGATMASESPTAADVEANAWWLADFPDTGFVDIVPGVFYEDAVAFLKANGITQGTSLDRFSPFREVTRAEMATFLFRLGGSQWPTIGTPFVDVPETSWFLEPVKWAYEQGITNGTSDTTFSPYAPVTRGQMAVFLWRMAGSPDVSAPHGFIDIDPTAYYEPAVRWLTDSGITSGVRPDEYAPDGEVTRGQMAAFLHRLVADYGWVPDWRPPS